MAPSLAVPSALTRPAGAWPNTLDPSGQKAWVAASRRPNSSAAAGEAVTAESLAVSRLVAVARRSRTTGAPPARAARAKSAKPAASAAVACLLARLVKLAFIVRPLYSLRLKGGVWTQGTVLAGGAPCQRLPPNATVEVSSGEGNKPLEPGGNACLSAHATTFLRRLTAHNTFIASAELTSADR